MSSPPVFSWIGVAQSLFFCVLYFRPLSFCPYRLAIVLSVLRFADSDYPFSIYLQTFHLEVLFLTFYHIRTPACQHFTRSKNVISFLIKRD